MGRTVLVVGGGGREHALAIGLVESPSVDSVHVAPGNAGTAQIATNHSVSASDVDGQVALAQTLGVDLVVVGPEAPLVAGLSDALRAIGIPSFGPHADGAMLEGSKDFAKQVMLDLGIPTAGVQHLTQETDLDEAIDDGALLGLSSVMFLPVEKGSSSQKIGTRRLNSSNLQSNRMAWFCLRNSLQAKRPVCLLYTSPSPRDRQKSRMPSSA